MLFSLFGLENSLHNSLNFVGHIQEKSNKGSLFRFKRIKPSSIEGEASILILNP